MVPLNALPTIIDAIGDYKTRDGRRVTIHEIGAPPQSGNTKFAAKGALWRMFRGKPRPSGFNIWHISGRAYVLSESPRDIVAKWECGVEP